VQTIFFFQESLKQSWQLLLLSTKENKDSLVRGNTHNSYIDEDKSYLEQWQQIKSFYINSQAYKV